MPSRSTDSCRKWSRCCRHFFCTSCSLFTKHLDLLTAVVAKGATQVNPTTVIINNKPFHLDDSMVTPDQLRALVNLPGDYEVWKSVGSPDSASSRREPSAQPQPFLIRLPRRSRICVRTGTPSRSRRSLIGSCSSSAHGLCRADTTNHVPGCFCGFRVPIGSESQTCFGRTAMSDSRAGPCLGRPAQNRSWARSG